MLSTKLKEAAGNSADATLYVDDVFSTYLYTGNGSTQTITNGIDLAGKGGLVWTKSRGGAEGGFNHILLDTIRGGSNYLSSNNQNGNSIDLRLITSFNSNGYSFGTGSSTQINYLNSTYASWTFRKAAKFFDVVTWTGNGVAGRQIAHSLGVAPGMIIIKCTSNADNWYVYHRSITLPNGIFLNLTVAAEDCSTRMNTAPTASVFTVETDAMVNASGRTYVAYLFAHDTSSTGIIQCGSFTKTASYPDSAPVVLGYEPQFILFKRIDSGTTENWNIGDIIRGDGNWGGLGAGLSPNLATSETSTLQFRALPTGFTIGNSTSIGGTYIYIAIRRPNKPPTSGTQVFASTGHNGTGATNDSITFDPVPYIDLTWIKSRNTAGTLWAWTDRLRGATKELDSSTTTAETTYANDVTSFAFMSASGRSISLGSGASGNVNTSSYTYSDIGFKRAPGFFDVVCYTGTGVATTQAHNLGVAPELMIVKNRSVAGYSWVVYDVASGNTKAMLLNTTGASTAYAPPVWNDTSPTATVFSVGTSPNNNTSGATYVAYLFATLAGISKVGSYTGNGTSQNINCGFAAGARFFLVKATSTTGSWWVWDSARGITAGNDPALQLNSTAAEITTADAVDPYSPGITVNQEATCSINANGVSYIFLAVA